MPAESTFNLEWLSLQILSDWSKRDWMRVCEWISANPSPLLEKSLWNPKHGSVASASGKTERIYVFVFLIFDFFFFCSTEKELKYKIVLNNVDHQTLVLVFFFFFNEISV